jgi:type VI protein secretion system component VasF
MSAKPTKPESRSATSPAPNATTVAAAAAEPAWIDSPDPRRRRWGKIALWVVWAYVGALWLLALDQWFGWGIFGPKISG